MVRKRKLGLMMGVVILVSFLPSTVSTVLFVRSFISLPSLIWREGVTDPIVRSYQPSSICIAGGTVVVVMVVVTSLRCGCQPAEIQGK